MAGLLLTQSLMRCSKSVLEFVLPKWHTLIILPFERFWQFCREDWAALLTGVSDSQSDF